MTTARTWKLAAGLALPILIALMAALFVARGTVGYSDWPGVAEAPVAEDTLVAGADEPRRIQQSGGGVTAPAVAAPEPVAAPQQAPEPIAEPEREREAEPERARAEPEPERVEEPAPAELAPETPIEPATDAQPELARPVEEPEDTDEGVQIPLEEFAPEP